VAQLKPKEKREVACRLTWGEAWREDESAFAEFVSADGRSIRKPLIPNRLTIHKAGTLVMDGDLSDWPAKNRLPLWVLGSTAGEPRAALFAAWADEGLYVAADVSDSKASVPDPRSFWVGDCLEVFIDTRDDKRARSFEPGDHQFWLCPQVERQGVYVGQWKRKAEIPATKYDIPGIKAASRAKQGGYVMECLIPADLLNDFNPKPGSRIGLNLNLTVKGIQLDREVYWPSPKSEGAPDRPETWGSVGLAD
ncbi:MAG: hypothetical protein FJ278_10090, partial [Planctomycetes bacterium]|nr:hypothetical protein [Planctomycetota bacterium]